MKSKLKFVKLFEENQNFYLFIRAMKEHNDEVSYDLQLLSSEEKAKIYALNYINESLEEFSEEMSTDVNFQNDFKYHEYKETYFFSDVDEAIRWYEWYYPSCRITILSVEHYEGEYTKLPDYIEKVLNQKKFDL